MNSNPTRLTTDAAELSVLLVDNDDLLRWSIGRMLRSHGYAVIEAQTASGARHLIRSPSGPVDAVLLDYRLPDCKGWELLEDVVLWLPRSVVILMTGLATPETVEGALGRGVYSVLIKPFDLNGLERLIRQAHQSSRGH